MFERYGSGATEIMQMECVEGNALFLRAREKKQDEMLFQRWIHGYQSQYGFDEFKKLLLHSAASEKPQDAGQILKKVKDILRKE